MRSCSPRFPLSTKKCRLPGAGFCTRWCKGDGLWDCFWLPRCIYFGHWGWRIVFVFGIAPLLVVAWGRRYIRETERFQQVDALRRAMRQGDTATVARLLSARPVAVPELQKPMIRQVFDHPAIRRQVVILGITWFFTGASFVATNLYISYFLTHYRGWTPSEVASLLLVSAGVGFIFYGIGGWLGERFGRKQVLALSAMCTVPLLLGIVFIPSHVGLWVVYFCTYQITNGLWAAPGFAYWAESFPTRVRGYATSLVMLGLLFGQVVGSAAWTVAIGRIGATATFLVVGVGLAVGKWVILGGRSIRPGLELEEVVS